MSEAVAPARMHEVVTAQLGREPRGPWRVAAVCPHGFPQVIACPSRLDDDRPFPTTFWLTCPHLREAASAAESAGGVGEWERRIAHEPELAARESASRETYVEARRRESGGWDACGGVGAGGVRREGSVKCLHARVGARLAGLDDPVGEGVLADVSPSCEDARCALLVQPSEGESR